MWCSFIHTQDIEIIVKPLHDVFRTAQLHGRNHDTMHLFKASVDGNSASQKEMLSEDLRNIF